ncbi:uncharacterized protein [Atheta coriaria]|uniref:uncharacterized protein isoform X1 n=1 Tax=Dalotia coriaria TaxID=877792 RepID=UPI0031F44698
MTKLKVKTPSKATPKKNNKEVAKSPAITPSKLTQKSPKKQKTPESRKRASKAAELVEDVSILKKKAKKEKNGWKKQPEPEKESDSAEDAASVNDVKEDIDSDEESDIEMTNANGGLNEDAENSDVEEESEGEDEEDSEAENEEANGEEASDEELYDTSTISVKPIRSMTSPEIIKEYFAKCGQITNCQLIVNPNTKKQKALITFQDVDEAKLAVATLSGSLFQHYKIKVQLVQTSCGFAEDGSILIKNLPQDTGIQSSEVLDYAKDALTKSFGPVKDLLLSSDMLQATVQFEDKAAATAALAAGSFQLLGCKVDIVPYGDAANLLCPLTLELLSLEKLMTLLKKTYLKQFLKFVMLHRKPSVRLQKPILLLVLNLKKMLYICWD